MLQSPFWTSIDKLANEGFKIAWFGVAVSIIGKLWPDNGWIFWLGIAATAVGIILRQRGEYLKKLETKPRKPTSTEKENLLCRLSGVPKSAIKVHFLGHDAESKQYAIQLKDLLELAGFNVEGFCGAIAFEPLVGLFITVCDWDAQNPTAIGIKNAFDMAGIPMSINAVMHQRTSYIQICVHKKPSRIENAMS